LLVIIWFYSYVLILELSTIYGTEWPIMCWCAVKKLLTHSLRDGRAVKQRFTLFDYDLCSNTENLPETAVDSELYLIA